MPPEGDLLVVKLLGSLGVVWGQEVLGSEGSPAFVAQPVQAALPSACPRLFARVRLA